MQPTVTTSLRTRSPLRVAIAAAVLATLGPAVASPMAAGASNGSETPRPHHVRLIYTGGAFSPVSVLWTTTTKIARIQRGTKIDAGAGVDGPPSSTVSSYGRCYQGYASSYKVKHLKIGSRYAVTIAIGHGDRERRYTSTLTLRRASLRGTARQLRCGR